MKGTVKEITAQLNDKGVNVTLPNVNGFINVLEALGKAKKVGSQKQANTRGRAATVFEVTL